MIQFCTYRGEPLPKDINIIANQRFEEYELKLNKKLKLSEKLVPIGKGFNFSSTPEGLIWYDVQDGKFKSFYEFHKKLKVLSFFDYNFY